MRAIARLLPALFFAFLTRLPLAADTLGGTVEFQPARGWVATPANHPSPYPTLRYAPAAGNQNATILLSLLPAERFDLNSPDTIRKLHLAMCRPYLGGRKDAPEQKEFKFSTGFGIFAVFEDPDLVGKPPQPGNHKIAIPVAASVEGKALVFITILCDDPAGASQAEAWRFIRSLALVTNKPAASHTAESASDGRPAFQAPAGFAAIGSPAAETGDRFMYVGPDGVILSGCLDSAAKFPGMRTFWAREKAALEKNIGPVRNESLSLVAGWNVVTYTMPVGAETQQNLRACRLFGEKWVDVHLSQTGSHASAETLKALLPKLAFVAKQ